MVRMITQAEVLSSFVASYTYTFFSCLFLVAMVRQHAMITKESSGLIRGKSLITQIFQYIWFFFVVSHCHCHCTFFSCHLSCSIGEQACVRNKATISDGACIGDNACCGNTVNRGPGQCIGDKACCNSGYKHCNC